MAHIGENANNDINGMTIYIHQKVGSHDPMHNADVVRQLTYCASFADFGSARSVAK